MELTRFPKADAGAATDKADGYGGYGREASRGLSSDFHSGGERTQVNRRHETDVGLDSARFPAGSRSIKSLHRYSSSCLTALSPA